MESAMPKDTTRRQKRLWPVAPPEAPTRPNATVWCDCTRCRGGKWVGDRTRRRHLPQDKLDLDAGGASSGVAQEEEVILQIPDNLVEVDQQEGQNTRLSIDELDPDINDPAFVRSLTHQDLVNAKNSAYLQLGSRLQLMHRKHEEEMRLYRSKEPDWEMAYDRLLDRVGIPTGTTTPST